MEEAAAAAVTKGTGSIVTVTASDTVGAKGKFEREIDSHQVTCAHLIDKHHRWN